MDPWSPQTEVGKYLITSKHLQRSESEGGLTDDDIFKCSDRSIGFINLINPRDLDKPAHVVRK